MHIGYPTPYTCIPGIQSISGGQTNLPGKLAQAGRRVVLASIRILRLVPRDLSLLHGEPSLVATSMRGAHGVHPALAGGPLVGAGHHGTGLAFANMALALLLDFLQCPGEAVSAGGGEGGRFEKKKE